MTNRKTIPVSFSNSPAEPVQFFQIWLLPSSNGANPGSVGQSPPDARSNTLTLACAPDGGEKSIKINQDAAIFVGKLAPEETVSHPTGEPGHTWIQLIDGDLDINGEKLASGDSAAIDDEREIRLVSEKGAHFLLFDLC